MNILDYPKSLDSLTIYLWNLKYYNIRAQTQLNSIYIQYLRRYNKIQGFPVEKFD